MKAKYLAIALPVFTAALALTVAPALARHGGQDQKCRPHQQQCQQQEGKVEVTNNNEADVENNLGAISNTGLNAVLGNDGDSTVFTGAALTDAYAATTANENVTKIAVKRYARTNVTNKNDADVDNNAGAISNTGLNLVVGCGCEEDGCNNECVQKPSRHNKKCGNYGHHGNHGDCGNDDDEDDKGIVYIETGNAGSVAEAMVMVNSNRTVIE